MNKSQFQIPVLFLIYNRPEESEKVIKQIKKVKPKYLYIAGDGAKNDSDKTKVNQTRNKVLSFIDWDCKVKTFFRKKNKGCKYAVSEAIDWFFCNVEQGIILEDDCFPDETFFYFCEEMLEIYKEDKEIFHISGTNIDGNLKTPFSYFFSKSVNVWGWATWKDRWENYDVEMEDYPRFKFSIFWEFYKRKGLSSSLRMRYIFDKVHNNEIDTWDYQWDYTITKNNGFSIIPSKNLIQNIGFENGTHTKGDERKITLYSLQKPFFEPDLKESNKMLKEYDKRFTRFFQGNLYKKAIKKLINQK